MYKIFVLNSYEIYENPVIRIMLYENSLIRIRLYVNSDICIMLYVSCNCGPLQVVISVICFPLNCKLNTDVSSIYNKANTTIEVHLIEVLIFGFRM